MTTIKLLSAHAEDEQYLSTERQDWLPLVRTTWGPWQECVPPGMSLGAHSFVAGCDKMQQTAANSLLQPCLNPNLLS